MAEQRKNQKTLYLNGFFILCFAVLLFFPFLKLFFPESDTGKESEKRVMAQKPVLKISDPWTFLNDLENYINDHFGFRKKLIQLNNIIKIKYLKVTTSLSETKNSAGTLSRESPEKVLFGKEDFCFWASKVMIEDYQRKIPFSKSELKIIKRNLKQRSNWFQQQGIKYYILAVPNKHTVYSEYLPDDINPVQGLTRMDQILEICNDIPSLKFIDIREDFFNLKKKQKFLLYQKTDTHWSEYGAFEAYKILIRILKQDFPQIQPLHIDDFKIFIKKGKGGDLAGMLMMRDYFSEEWLHLIYKKIYQALDVKIKKDQKPYAPKKVVIKKTDNLDLPRVLIYRDCFSDRLIPYLSENFSRSVYVDTHEFDLKIIKKEKPDIFIHQIIEKFLRVLLLENPPEIRSTK